MKTELNILAENILKVNPDCSISGSLALNMQNIRTKNEPGDIDIYVPSRVRFNPIEKMKENNDFNRDDYRNDEYERRQYYFDKIKIDVFTPIEGNPHGLITEYSKGLKVVRFDEIIKFKVRFAFDDHTSAEKHKQDVLFIMEQANKPFPLIFDTDII